MRRAATAPAAWLPARTSERLERRIADALAHARSTGRPTVASVTVALAGAHDPSATVSASRRAGEDWFCLEQPDRDAIALAGLGVVRRLEAAGEGRFGQVAERWRTLAADAAADEAGDAAPGAGLTCLGGFAFDAAGGEAPLWRGFAPASLVVPEISLARRGERTWLTVNVELAPDDTAADALRRVRHRLGELRAAPLPLLDPAPTGVYDVVSPMPPAHFEEAVARATARIATGEFEKVVLAREVDVHAPRAHDAAAILGLLRVAFATSFVYAVGRGEATFIGATPELLIRRQGQRASTVALAGSTRRSADPAVDAHLGERLLRSDKDRHENAIVARRIVRSLRPYSVWVTAAAEPVVIQVANIQHLAAPIRAQLTAPIDAITLAGHLHPTPAVGAEPATATAAIPALEGFDRGWYAGALGWSDAGGDGEFCVALRCALLRDRLARCYAGCGVVRDSDPAAELAESEVKLGVMLPVLAG
ncbi:MAG: isochorismate synthase [Solirubrobacterales bacterium]|nr:isochorismate synthase [Solirubrobacterales bacterium]